MYITPQDQQDESGITLQESQRRFSDLLGNVQLISLMLDRNAQISYCNDYLLSLTSRHRDEVIGQDWFETFVDADDLLLRRKFSDLLENQPTAWHHENEIFTRTGERRLVQWDNTVLRSITGDVIGTASIGKDVTDVRRGEERIRRLNRVRAMLSSIAALTVRADCRSVLYDDACRIAAEAGGFRLACIAMVDPATQEARVVAASGEVDSYPLGIRIAAGCGNAHGDGPGSAALQTGKPVICNDVLTECGPAFVRDRLLEAGHRSFASLPLTIDAKPVGLLILFSSLPDAFDREEAELLVELARDISFALDHIETKERLHYLAYYDGLTGLANDAQLHERIEQLIVEGAGSARRFALLIVDLKRFKSINDTFGRQAGDSVLRAVAGRLASVAVSRKYVARIGADHFAILMPDVGSESEAVRRAGQKYRDCFHESYAICGHDVRVAAKIGVAMFPDDGTDAEALFRNAEVAVRKAKLSSETMLFYVPSMTESAAKNLELERALRRALEHEEFVLHYQPKVDLGTRRIEGVEGLIRWQSPDRGLVAPLDFVPLLEETGLIVEVGAWVLRRAALDYRGWLDAGLPAPRIAVNVSAVQLRRRDFLDMVTQTLRAVGLTSGIDFELTESLVMENVSVTIERLQALVSMGGNIAIDDFGTGYSSLAYLAKLPVQVLKIDRSFVATMLESPDNMTLVSTMIALAHSLRMTVVAEGVESEETARMLHLLRCDQMQGYLISPAVPRDEIAAMLRSGSMKG